MSILVTKYGISQKLFDLAQEKEKECLLQFKEIERIQEQNQLWVLDCFREERVASTHFAGSYGYGTMTRAETN